jgi:hypothetical protein
VSTKREPALRLLDRVTQRELPGNRRAVRAVQDCGDSICCHPRTSLD